jgi:hypothetical protein
MQQQQQQECWRQSDKLVMEKTKNSTFAAPQTRLSSKEFARFTPEQFSVANKFNLARRGVGARNK